MADNADHDELISRFCSFTSASPADAEQYLSANRWDVENAVVEYFQAQEEAIQGAQGGADDPQEAEAYTGPRTLDGRPAPAAIPTYSSSSKSAARPKKGGFATLDSLNEGSSSGGHGHVHDDDDDSDDEDYTPDEQPRDLFAGGEKSGLAVQDPARSDPRKVVNDILKKARANASRSGASGGEPSAPVSRFRGAGQTLGGDDTPSQVVPDPNPQAGEAEQVQTRTLHLWNDGFSIEDGELRRFDDPQNASDLRMIRAGRAPLHLMNVTTNQPVDIQLVKHDEDYKPQPKQYKPFSGSGQRLGSPTPGGSSTTPTSSTSAPAAANVPIPENIIDSSAPTISLRIQLANGTRLPARFNSTQTIGDVYDFIGRAAQESNSRNWVLATTFPNKEHTDKSLALGDVAEFKRGGNAVQKYT